MIQKFFEWCLDIQPAWAGGIVWLSTIITVTFAFLIIVGLIITWTKGWILLVIPAFVLYCFYIALFLQ